MEIGRHLLGLRVVEYAWTPRGNSILIVPGCTDEGDQLRWRRIGTQERHDIETMTRQLMVNLTNFGPLAMNLDLVVYPSETEDPACIIVCPEIAWKKKKISPRARSWFD